MGKLTDDADYDAGETFENVPSPLSDVSSHDNYYDRRLLTRCVLLNRLDNQTKLRQRGTTRPLSTRPAEHRRMPSSRICRKLQPTANSPCEMAFCPSFIAISRFPRPARVSHEAVARFFCPHKNGPLFRNCLLCRGLIANEMLVAIFARRLDEFCRHEHSELGLFRGCQRPAVEVEVAVRAGSQLLEPSSILRAPSRNPLRDSNNHGQSLSSTR
ncbi:unnamed protein product [Protopolystoma xenopodis]|uniref:Uncharacterized protein n=1 Tax=Protopolystoma xenopodis TaxID=117903 RepID=A0A3S5FFP1_9PLAT|nr:unnamed protein product [Protopolystoma xenopodis]